MKQKMSASEAADWVAHEIREFARSSPSNLMPDRGNYRIFDEPLVAFADGDDPLFEDYRRIIDTGHLTPRDALRKAFVEKANELPPLISVISWILPIAEETRKSNRAEVKTPTRLWTHTRWYGEHFNEALRRHMVTILRERGYLAVAPAVEPYFRRMNGGENSPFSNWSERHVAFAAGLGTFSLSDGFISERGIAHRCGSVVTDLPLPVNARRVKDPYGNCLFYANGSCKACIARCPCGAITELGHDKKRCESYLRVELDHLLGEHGVGVQGCGLCQTGVPCESRNPARDKKSI